MAIIKSSHAGNYTTIPNEVFKCNLSAQALGVLVYMLSLPPQWVVHKSQLREFFKIGRDGMNNIINELEKVGYFLSVQKRDSKGLFTYEYIVYDKPYNGEVHPHTPYPLTDDPHTDRPSTDNPHTDEPYDGQPTSIKEIYNKETSILNTNDIKDTLSIDSSFDFDKSKFIEFFNQITNKRFRVLDDKAYKQIKKLLKQGYTKKEVAIAIKNCMADQYHIDNPKYLTPEFITREDKFTKYLCATPTKEQTNKFVPSIADQIEAMRNG